MKPLYGAQTRLAIENFTISGIRFPRAFIRALGLIKAAAARVNGLKVIERAANAVADGRYDDQFPLDVFQTGSGTSTNMNANEVIASLASAHPNDDVNRGQSSNDVIPSATHVAVVLETTGLIESLDVLAAALGRKARAFRDIVKLGRTHLMPAVPVTLGQEFSGYEAQVRKAVARIRGSVKSLHELAIGGTAVGTGMNAPKGFGRKVCAELKRRTRIPFREARNHFEAQASRDDLVAFHGTLVAAAGALVKIANDIRWMGSLGELLLPELQAGSSIMPGKVNPVMSEVVVQVGAQILGNQAAVAVAGQSGAFELNAMIPVMAHNVLQSVGLLAAASRSFAEKCIEGLKADEERCRELAMKSPALATVLNSRLGYDRAAALVKEAARLNVGVKELAIHQKLITRAEADRLFDLTRLT